MFSKAFSEKLRTHDTTLSWGHVYCFYLFKQGDHGREGKQSPSMGNFQSLAWKWITAPLSSRKKISSQVFRTHSAFRAHWLAKYSRQYQVTRTWDHLFDKHFFSSLTGPLSLWEGLEEHWNKWSVCLTSEKNSRSTYIKPSKKKLKEWKLTKKLLLQNLTVRPWEASLTSLTMRKCWPPHRCSVLQ